MGFSTTDGIGPLAGYASAALLCATLTQWLSLQESEIYSEIVCWSILPILMGYQKEAQRRPLLSLAVSGKHEMPPSPTSSLWLVAGSVTIFSLFRMATDLVQFLPGLTPLLLAVQRYLGSASRPHTGFFSPFVSTIWGTMMAALLEIFTFAGWNIRGSLSSVIPTAALLIVYTAFLPRSRTAVYLPSVKIECAIRPLSARIIILLSLTLGFDIIAYGFTRIGIIDTLFLGLLKAVYWYFVIQLAQIASWSTAPIISIFSIASTNNPFNKPSDVQPLVCVFISIISLGQLISLLPKQTKFRRTLWLFGLISFVPFLLNLWMIRAAQQSAPIFGPEQEHPVETLVRNGKMDFEHLLKRQSQTYKDAVETYRKRYGAVPPPGFEAWYEFALHHRSPIIDDFDAIYHAVSPFWDLSGRRVLEIMNELYYAPDSEMWFCIFYGEHAMTRCMHPDRIYDRHIEYHFDSLLYKLKGVLPDIRFLFNHLDEPRILIPKWGVEDAQQHQPVHVRNMSRQPVWDEITKYCVPKESQQKAAMQASLKMFDLPFVTDHSSAIDLCEHPEYRNMHGLFMSPVSFSLVEGLVPALSTGSPSSMGDILFPSPAYTELEFTYDDAREVGWNEKSNNLYWAGSTTSGFASDANWTSFHRQRFVKLAQNMERQQYNYLRETGGIIQRVASSFLNSRLFDVAFTKIFQCERKYCRDQKRFFKVGGWADKDKALRSRLVFDLDGNGISGRYYKLLASKSAPLKQTLLREWHDDRLVPWVHYIPVSQSLEELPELVFYLTSTEAGQERAKEIAEQGRDWFFTALREDDMAVYAYRLLLELARLQDPNREAGLPEAV